MRAFISTQEFNSAVVTGDDLMHEEVIAEGLTITQALIFGAAEDMQNAIRRFFAATDPDETHHAMVAMEEALAKSEGNGEMLEY